MYEEVHLESDELDDPVLGDEAVDDDEKLEDEDEDEEVVDPLADPEAI